MTYTLFYWPGIQGRGEFVRLALEEGAADYTDIALLPESRGGGVPAMQRYLKGGDVLHPPFAPPFLQAGRQLIGQTANILLFLGGKLDLAPKAAAGKLWAHQLQLTIADLVAEVHDTHHPVALDKFYAQQKTAARQRSKEFLAKRLPKFLGYFEQVLQRNPQGTARQRWLVGDRLSYVDLSMAQVVAGLQFAFPKAARQALAQTPGLLDLHGCVFARPRIKRYTASKRRLKFNNDGIFRHYPELDMPSLEIPSLDMPSLDMPS